MGYQVFLKQLSMRLLCLIASSVVVPVQDSQTWRRLSCSHSVGLKTSISLEFQTGEDDYCSSVHVRSWPNVDLLSLPPTPHTPIV